MKAKHIATIVLCFLVWRAEAQQDTIYYDTPHEAIDYIMQNLSPTYYEGKLLERSLSDAKVAYEQAHGNYNQTHSAFTWLSLYSCVHYSYIDSTLTFSNDKLIDKIEDFFEASERNSTKDELIQPFGLLLHQLNHFDSSVVYNGGVSEQNNQLVANVPQQTLYEPVMIKSAALLEFYGESGYTTGNLKYDERFISTSDDITLNSMRIDVGSGFQDFGIANPVLEYNRSRDSIVAHLAVNYTLDGTVVNDTLQFYLTTKTGNKDKSLSKSEDPWDNRFNYDYDNAGVKFRVAVKFGCGNSTNQARRPIIIAPPYRPKMQLINMSKYYNQFNIYGLIDMLTELGYDVYFIKVKPGNASLEASGNELMHFLYYINEQKSDNCNANFPGELWENVVMGFSAGGQIARYALLKAEKMHMYSGYPHPHTRLYIAFDSPHWGANVPMFAQASIYEMKRLGNIYASLVFNSMVDEASKDMLRHNIISSNLTEASNHNWQLYPNPTSERVAFMASLNSYSHTYTHTGDLRKTFPTFSRNIAISTGRNDINYTSDYGLAPGMIMFAQNTPVLPTTYGESSKHRLLFASQYGASKLCFYNNEIDIFLGVIPIPFYRLYSTNGLYEWDMAQGGYKDEFYDKNVGILPISPVGIMRNSGWYLGTRFYKSHVSFLPLVSALGINPSIWQNNNLLYKVKDQGLMFQSKYNFNHNISSNFFGYPNVGRPNNHFNITPFEAVYADTVTYEHIKIVASADPNHLEFIDSLRNFILNEVEAETVYLQNQIIGQNHVNWMPNYVYKAWYKAKNKIIIGEDVTPKTDKGPYTVQESGDITVYAGQEIVLEPGFTAEYGSRFEAFIAADPCQIQWIAQRGNAAPTNNHASEQLLENNKLLGESLSLRKEKETALLLYPNPNTGSFALQLPKDEHTGRVQICDMLGRTVYEQQIQQQKLIMQLHIPKGLYNLRFTNEKITQTLQFVVQ